MRSAAESGRRGGETGDIPKEITAGRRSGDGDDRAALDDGSKIRHGDDDAAPLPRTKWRERRPQMPPEHDGGVLCLCPVPDNLRSPKGEGNDDGSTQTTHRFLSGGTDGLVKLWQVRETSGDGDGRGRKMEMLPRLVRTYRGHSGYVHSIAVLGTFSMPEKGDSGIGDGASVSASAVRRFARRDRGGRDSSRDSIGGSRHRWLDESSRHSNVDMSSRRSLGSVEQLDDDDGDGPPRAARRPRRVTVMNVPLPVPNVNMPTMGGMGRRMSQITLDSAGSGRSGDRARSLKNRLLFVSASRDNTCRIWPVDADDDDAGMANGRDFDVGGGGDLRTNGRSNGKRGDPNLFAGGIKLRGHQFGNNVMGGVLCVCALPSVTSEMDESARSDDDRSNSGGGGGSGDSEITESTVSAGQFCSGGSDGRIRVMDVRSAVGLVLGKSPPRPGMYGTVQLQCINAELQYGPAPVTSLICTHPGGGALRGEGEVALFAGDAGGIIRRYSRMNECGEGHVNSAIWWGCTGVFSGHSSPITSMAKMSSLKLFPLLCPNDNGAGDEGEDVGTMLVSSCKDGAICVWDAFDARIRHSRRLTDSSDRSNISQDQLHGRSIPKRVAMWEIDLNEDFGGGDADRPLHSSHLHRPSATANVGVTSLTTLQLGTLMAAGTTDGAIRMWNVSSGLYEGAYNLGRSVQIWSLGMLSESRPVEDESGDEDDCSVDRRKRDHNTGIIVSGDNRGRIRVLRKNYV